MKIPDPTTYALGHSPEEIERLGTQAAVIDPMTRRTFQEAGIGPGMRVLDIGCGPGYISTLVADLVGPEGEVLGVDINPIALQTASSRVQSLGLKNVSFRQGDPSQMSFDGTFDAIVGRYILMFLPDPAAMLRATSKHLRPGGTMAFHEVAWYSASSQPSAPVYDAACRWLVATVNYMKADPDMGLHLLSAFKTVGLPPPNLRVESLIGAGETSVEVVRLVSDLIRTQLDSVVASGASSAEEIGIDSLHRRMLDEIIALGSTVVCRGEIGAWTKVS